MMTIGNYERIGNFVTGQEVISEAEKEEIAIPPHEEAMSANYRKPSEVTGLQGNELEPTLAAIDRLFKRANDTDASEWISKGRFEERNIVPFNQDRQGPLKASLFSEKALFSQGTTIEREELEDLGIQVPDMWLQGASSEPIADITQHAKRLLEHAISASKEEVANVLASLQTVPAPENADRISSSSLYLLLLDVIMAYFDRAMMLEDPADGLTAETRENYRQALGKWDHEKQSVAIRYRHEYVNESLNFMTDQTLWGPDLRKPLADALTKLSRKNPLGLKEIYDIAQKYSEKSWYLGILVVRALTHHAVNSEASCKELKAFLKDMYRDNWRLIYAGAMALAHVIIHTDSIQVRQQAWNTDEQAPGFVCWVDMFCRQDSFLHKDKAAADSFLAAFFKVSNEVNGTCLDKVIQDTYVKLENTCRQFELFDSLQHFHEHPLRSPTQLQGCFPSQIPLALPRPFMMFPNEKAVLPEDVIDVPAIEEALRAYLDVEGSVEQKFEALKRWCTRISQCRQTIWMHAQNLHRWMDSIQQTLKKEEHHALKSYWIDFTDNRHNCCQAVVDLGILLSKVEKNEQVDAYETLDRLVDKIDQVQCPIDPEFLQMIIKHSHRLAAQLLEQAAQENGGRYTAADVYRCLGPITARLTGDRHVQFLQEAGDCYCQAPLSADTIAAAAAYYHQAWVLSESYESRPLALQQRLSYLLALRCFVALSHRAKQLQGTEETALLLPLFHQIEALRNYLKNGQNDEVPRALRAGFLTLDQQFEEETVLPLVRTTQQKHFPRAQDLQPIYSRDHIDEWQQLFPLLETWQCHQTAVRLIKSCYQQIVASCKHVRENVKEYASIIKEKANAQIRHIDRVDSNAITVADDTLSRFLPAVDLNFWQKMYQEWKGEQDSFRDAIKGGVNAADALRRYGEVFQSVLSACLQYCIEAIGPSHEGKCYLFYMDTFPYAPLLTDQPLMIALLKNAAYREEFCRCFAMLVHVITGHRIQLHDPEQGVAESKPLIGPPHALTNHPFEQLARGLALTAAKPCQRDEASASLWQRYQELLGYAVADPQIRQEKATQCLQELARHYPGIRQSNGPEALAWLLAWLRAIAWYHNISSDDPFALIQELSQHMQSLWPANDRHFWMIHPDFLQDIEHAFAQALQAQAETRFDAKEQESLEEKIAYVAGDRDSRFFVFDLEKDILAPAYQAITRCRDMAGFFDPVWDPLEKELQRMMSQAKADDAIKQFLRFGHQQLADKSAREIMLHAGDPLPLNPAGVDDFVQFFNTCFTTLREVLQVTVRRTRHRDPLSRVDAHLNIYRRLPPPLRAIYRTQLDDLLKIAQKKDRSFFEHLRDLLLNTPDPDGSRPCHAPGHPDNPFAGWHRKMHGIIQTEPPEEVNTPIEVQWYDPYQKCFEKGYLRAAVQAQLIDEQSMRFDKNRRPARCRTGQRVVIPLHFTGNDARRIDAYAKEFPEMPLMQYQVQMLCQRISGIALPVTLCRFAPKGKPPYSVLFSEAVDATLLDHMVSEWQGDEPRLKDGGDLTAVESQLSGYYFTLKFFEHILMRFDDAQFANMGTVACTTPDHERKLCLIEIDADHAFADSVALYAEEKVPDDLQHRANVKTCLYTFQQALNPVDQQAVDLFLSLDPKAVLTEWLQASDRLHEAYFVGAVEEGRLRRGLFHEDAKKLYADNQSYVGCITHETLVLSVYQRWRQLQQLLRKSLDTVTLWNVFEGMEPQLVDFYPHPSTHENPFVRFKEARLAYREFSLKEADDEKDKEARRITEPYFTTTTTSEKQLSRCLDRRVHKENQSFGYKVRHMGESEAARLSHHIGKESHMMRPKQLIRHLIAFDHLYERVDLLKKEIANVYAGKMEIFNHLPSPELLLSSMSMAEMFRTIDDEIAKILPDMVDKERLLQVKKIFRERQQRILAAITPEQYWQCQKLKLSGFTILTDNQLKTILSYCPGLISLDISGSEELIDQGEQMQLSANVIDQIGRYCQYLHYLNTSRLPKVDMIEQYNFRRYVGLPMPPVDFPKLEAWVMESSQVVQIKVAAPRLQRIELSGCEGLIHLETGSAKCAALEDTINYPDFDLSAVTFGKADWKRYFGDVEEEPPLPDDIRKTLNSPCPFWKGKRVHHTHLLMLIPKRVNGKPLTLNTLGELVKWPRGGGHVAKYRSYNESVKREFGDQGVGWSYWFLMTKDVLKGSRYKNYDKQRALVEEYAKRTGLSYQMPHALEAAVSILMHHAKTGERMYRNEPWIHTRCQEMLNNGRPLAVGGFSAEGLCVEDYLHRNDGGVGAVRKLCAPGLR